MEHSLFIHNEQSRDALSTSPNQRQRIVDPTLRSANTAHGADWLLAGTMRDAYAEHDPLAMFPDPSSTVPNATLTQQRVMEGVFAPNFLGSDVDGSRTPFQPDASIPWSEYLKSPTDTAEPPKSSAQQPRMSQHLSGTTPGASPHDQPAVHELQRERQKSLTLVGCHSQDDDPNEPSPRVMNTSPDRLSPLTAEATKSPLQQQASLRVTAGQTARDRTPKPSRNPCKEKVNSSLAAISDDDLATLGIPKEQ